ncbi:hypothetical protein LI012_10790 [Caldibacillus thermoamylovorans]|uniref:hypothetical protein n=1 Tax=Caldibacillus thermoamylovorans TaxID=35841 RepID=UPI001D070658|nr:hypothetical protein [Caldibacillus thermoamylovorans]MCB7077303.1 hypothetical protein [Caldibacillus thermoamylovorans]
MYQSYSPYYEYNENSRTEYYHPMLYPMADNFPAAYDERQFNLPPFFPGGILGPQQGPPSFSPPIGQPGGGEQGAPPTGAPPSFIPTQQAGVFAVDPGGIRRCLFRYTYVWLNNGQQFWFYPIFVGRRSVAGWRWIGFTWVYFGIDLRQIQSFTCV